MWFVGLAHEGIDFLDDVGVFASEGVGFGNVVF